MADQPGQPGGRRESAGGRPHLAKAIAHADDPEKLSAYADRSSVTPGDPVGLHVSTTAAKYTVTAYRMGWYGGAWRARSDAAGAAWDEAVREQGLSRPPDPYAEWNQSLQVDTADRVPGIVLVPAHRCQWRRVAGSPGRPFA